MKKIGVITSGGDVPGLNACIRAVTRTALSHGVEVMGVQRGYAGLMECDFPPLDSRAVGGIVSRGGTILGTARSHKFMTEEGRDLCVDALQRGHRRAGHHRRQWLTHGRVDATRERCAAGRRAKDD